MFNFLLIELYKIFRKWRTYIGFGAIGILIPVIHFSFYISNERGTFALSRLQDSFVFSGNIFNGYTISYLILFSLFVHIPFLLALVGGDLLAGEATSGTYRLLITRPITRFQIVTAKFLAGVIYTTLLIIWLAIMSLVVGLIFFGQGVLVVAGEKIIIFAQNDILWRFIAAYGFAVLSMSVIISLSFFLSSLVENAIGPIIATMAIIIIFTILSVLDFDILAAIKPYLFTNYLGGWTEFFRDPIDYSALLKDIFVLTAHIAGFYLITLIIFIKKDILT
jgi:ABC-2 type transport system permease protein